MISRNVVRAGWLVSVQRLFGVIIRRTILKFAKR